MGINGLFPKISPACHPADVVALLRPGLSASSDDTVGLPPLDETSSGTRNANGKRSADAAAADASDTATGPTKRRRTGTNASASAADSSSRKTSNRRRRVRVAVDASGWIARAAHGQGTHLLDERTLTNYGRAELTGAVEQGSNAAASAATAASDGHEGSGAASSAAEGAADQDAHDQALRQEYKQRCVTTVIKRVLSLRDVCLADVLVVLDGCSPPIKKATVGQRRSRRDAAAALRDAPVADADEQQPLVPSESDRISAAKRAGPATSQIQYEIVHAVMVALQSECIPYLVAPYEADGQLGYLARRGLVDMIVTDDTDLVACGAPSILYKFSDWGLNHGVSGGVVSGGVTGQLFLRSRLGCVPSPLSLMDFTDVMLAALFVAAGCDYCKNLRGIGVVTARKCVKEAFHGYGPNMSSSEADADNPMSKKTSSSSSHGDSEPKLSKLFRLLYLNSYGGKKMTLEERAEYETNFCKALIMYRHPVVFDPIAARCVVVSDPAMGFADPEFCTFGMYADLVNDPAMLQGIVGKILDPARAALIAEGRINARTGRPFGEKKDDQTENDEQEGSRGPAGTATGGTEMATSAVSNSGHRAMLIDTGEEEQKEEADVTEEEETPKQASEGIQEAATGESEEDEEDEMLATQQPQQIETHSQELESQTELSAAQASPPEAEMALSFATEAELPSTQSQLPQTQEELNARESLSLAIAAVSEAQALTAVGTQDSVVASQPATQASSGNNSQLSSSQSQDPDALSPDLLAPSPSQKKAGTQDDDYAKDGDKDKAKAAEKGPAKSTPKAQRQKNQAQLPPRGIQGVLSRLMGRK